jgi:outer membrane protein OmpA-like peptidoglycan-associated protein
MKPSPLRPLRHTLPRAALVLGLLAGVPVLGGLTGCLATGPTVLNDELPFEQAVSDATDGLVGQTQKLPGFLGKVESKISGSGLVGRRAIVIDPMLDSSSGQQTAGTQLLERRVADRLNSNFGERFEVLPFRASNLKDAHYLLTGTLTRQQTGAPGKGSKTAQRINLALTELATGKVVAQATALARDAGVDSTPLPYYRDSPVVVKDPVIEGYIRTSSARPGDTGDRTYLDRLGTATVIHEATTNYNAERYHEALTQYRSAMATKDGEQLRSVNGVYLSNAKLGRTSEAEQAFGRVVAMGIANNELGVKFLFNPGSTEFWSDRSISGPYGMWLRQIAKEARNSRACFDIVGHTSRTGSEATNDALSRQRADVIRQRLVAEASELGGRTKTSGMGFRQNLVGSGTDNAVDALDRRVEFKIVPCG